MRLGLAIAALGLLVLITTLSLTQAQTGISVNHFDKLAHGLAYCVLGFTVLPALAHVRMGFVWGGLCLYGIAMEITQGMMNVGRKADVLDAVANASGALMAILLWVAISFVVYRRQK